MQVGDMLLLIGPSLHKDTIKVVVQT